MAAIKKTCCWFIAFINLPHPKRSGGTSALIFVTGYWLLAPIGLSARLYYAGYSTELFYPGAAATELQTALEKTLNAGDVILEDVNFPGKFYLLPVQAIRRQALPLLSGPKAGFTLGRLGPWQLLVEMTVAFSLPQNTLFYQGAAELNEVRLCIPSNIEQCPLARWGFVEQSTGRAVYQLTATANEVYAGLVPALAMEFHSPLAKYHGELYAGVAVQYYQIYSRQDFSWQINRVDDNDNSYAIVARWYNRGVSGRGFSLRPYLRWQFTWPVDLRLGLQIGYLWLNNQTQQSLTAIKNNEIYAIDNNWLAPSLYENLVVSLHGLTLEAAYRWGRLDGK